MNAVHTLPNNQQYLFPFYHTMLLPKNQINFHGRIFRSNPPEFLFYMLFMTVPHVGKISQHPFSIYTVCRLLFANLHGRQILICFPQSTTHNQEKLYFRIAYF